METHNLVAAQTLDLVLHEIGRQIGDIVQPELAKSPVVDNYDLSSVKQVFSGAAPLGAELAAEASERVGCEVVQGYGMTELSPVTHATVEGTNHPGTSGVAISNVECRIVDPESGEDKGVGERGELWVRGPMVMQGYLNNEEATAATIDAKLSSIRVIAAASLLTSVPVMPIATPMSAFFRAGASFTPSPVIATM